MSLPRPCHALLTWSLVALLGCSQGDEGASSDGAGRGVSALPPGVGADVAPAVERALAAVAAAPDDAVARLELGMVYDANSLPDLAAEAYAQAVALDPDEPRARYHLARMLRELGRDDEALAALEPCVAAASYAPALATLADWYLEVGRAAEARAVLERAARVDPSHPSGVEGLARLDLAEGDPGGAVRALEPWLMMHPGRGHARFLLGTAYRQLGRVDQARDLLASALGSSPAWPDPWLDDVLAHAAGYLSVMDQAVALGASGEASRAIGPLTRLLAEHPDDVSVTEKLVAALLQTSDPGRAEQVLDAFMERHPDHPRAWYLMALVHEARGRLPEALQAVERSLATQPAWGPAHELAARLRWRSGDLRGSAEELEAAIRYGGARPELLQKLARARQLAEEQG